MKNLSDAESIWAADFEYTPVPGSVPKPVCFVGRELRTGREVRLWGDEMKEWRIPSGPRDLFIAYQASAEFLMMRELGWELPRYVLDLYAEYRVYSNARLSNNSVPKAGLVDACEAFRIPFTDSSHKDAMRELIIAGGPWSPENREAILQYCADDVAALFKLLPHLMPQTEQAWRAAFLRGSYAEAVSFSQQAGIPVDVDSYELIRANREAIISGLYEEANREFPVFQGKTLKRDLLKQMIEERGYSWPKTKTGVPSTSEEVVDDLVRRYPELRVFKEAHRAASKLKDFELNVGEDGRSRGEFIPFVTTTGRNAHKKTYIFGRPKWLRHLIQAEPGKFLAELDWSSQEVAIAAYLSGDHSMIAAVQSGDPYLALAKASGYDASYRDTFKVTLLSSMYGATAHGIQKRNGISFDQAKSLLRDIQNNFSGFADWQDKQRLIALEKGYLETARGWRVKTSNLSEGSIINFPMQALGSDMLRIASLLMMRRGIRLLGPNHDSVLIEGDLEDEDEILREASDVMEQAARLALNLPDGPVPIRSDRKVFHGRYEADPETWKLVMSHIQTGQSRLAI